ncbi:MAG: hypothetical protein LBR50_07435 [Tannerella sp.]|jgi:hypothetical protein|nr:hypothetical protein [Tannerella sp.]
MATPIRSIPVLEGKVADAFLKEARKVERKPHTVEFSESTRLLVRKANNDLRNQYAAL